MLPLSINNTLLVQGSINRSPWPWQVVEEGKKVAHDNEDAPEIGVYNTNNNHKLNIFSSSLSPTILRLNPTWARIWRGRALWSQTRALTPALSEDLVKRFFWASHGKKASLSRTHVRFQRVGGAKLTPDTLFTPFQGDLTINKLIVINWNAVKSRLLRNATFKQLRYGHFEQNQKHKNKCVHFVMFESVKLC